MLSPFSTHEQRELCAGGFAHTGSPTPLAPSAASLVVDLAEGSAFSCKASPFCCISTEQQERKTVGFYALPEAFPPNFNNPAISLLVGGELQFVRFSSSTASPSSTTVSSPVCTTPFLFSKDSFNCSFTLSNFLLCFNKACFKSIVALPNKASAFKV